MNVKIILNPYANRWRARMRRPEMETALTTADLTYELAITERPGQGAAIARQAAQSGRFDAVVAAGGDGSISEVVNGLIRASGDGPTRPLGILPLGSANDFSDMVGVPRDLATAVAAIAAGKTRQVDAIQVEVDGEIDYSLNNSAVAMEPMITLEQEKIQRISGAMRYLVAILRGLIKLQAWQMQIQWDGGGYEGPTYLLSLCNGPRTGGFYMAPTARVDDGRLDFVFAPQVPKLTVVAILLRLFQKTHIHHPQVTYQPTTSLTLTSQPPTPIHVDGELVSRAATAVGFHILPGKVTLLTQ